MAANAPKYARWAANMLTFSACVVALAGFLALALAGRSTGMYVGAAGIGSIAAAVFFVAAQLRRRQRWAYRTALALAALELGFGVFSMFFGRFTLPWFPGLQLWFLLHPTTRRWINHAPLTSPPFERAPDEPSLAAINERMAQRPINRD